MAIGHNKGEAKELDIEKLRSDYREALDNIRAIKGTKKDLNDLSSEDKGKLRVLYTKASGLAKQIAARTTDDLEKQDLEKMVKVLIERARSFGSSASATIPTTTFDDVKGLENVKSLVKSFMYMAQNPQVVKYYNITGGLGMMMYGAPGTGKTMFAEAIANAMQLPLFKITPADIYKSYVGESEAAVKQLFEELDACPEGAILFVDECESIFSKRTNDTKDYKAAVTTELLQRINGFGVDGSNRILIGATNRPDQIDPAYLRYKRFSHQIHVTPPDEIAIKAIIKGKLNIDKKGKTPIALEGITVDDIYQIIENSTYAINENALTGIKKEHIGYYSSADICGIIEETCRVALEILQANQSSTVIPLTREMFEKSIKKFKPSISEKLLREYEDFSKPDTMSGN